MTQCVGAERGDGALSCAARTFRQHESSGDSLLAGSWPLGEGHSGGAGRRGGGDTRHLPRFRGPWDFRVSKEDAAVCVTDEPGTRGCCSSPSLVPNESALGPLTAARGTRCLCGGGAALTGLRWCHVKALVDPHFGLGQPASASPSRTVPNQGLPAPLPLAHFLLGQNYGRALRSGGAARVRHHGGSGF